MAGKSGNKSKTTNRKKKVSNSSGSRLVNKKLATEEEKGLKHEIAFWIILGGCILLLVSNLGLGGKVGDGFSKFSFGLFGLFNHLLPIILFVFIAFNISNKNHRLIHLKIIAEIIFIILICTLIQLITIDYNPEIKFLEYYKISSIGKSGGGIIGGVFSKLLIPTFGVAGTYVFILISLIICIVIITEKSVMKGVRKGGSKVYQTAREDSLRRKERSLHKQEVKALKKEKRVNKVVKGVAIDTKIEKKASDGDELHEITNESMNDIPISDSIWGSSGEVENIWEAKDSQLIDEGFSVNTSIEEVTDNQEDIPSHEESLHTGSTKKELSALNSTEKKNDSETIIISKDKNKESKKYVFPSLSLLKKSEVKNSSGIDKHLKETAFKLQKTLGDFGVGVTITNVSKGPAVTRYELQPENGVKVSKIVSLSDDIKLNLAAADIRIEAPIPGKAAIGIEVPNKENTAVMLRDLLEDDAFKKHPSNIAFAVGKDISGQTVVADIAKMPHLLIAGATGSGKSVCINTIIMSILFKSSPEDVKLIMIDPKVVELSIYNGIPHLFIPVVTDPKKAAGALNWAVAEMSDRYKKFAELNVRDLKGYNEKIKTIEDIDKENKPTKLPQIVIIVDELADLMMVAPGEVEDAICRLAQLARAAGLHLILATQRPSVNVITGLIKANMPSRIAFSVSSGVDSRTIIDMNGAEKLLGKGDMLFYPTGYQKPARVQGVFVSDKEVGKVVEFLMRQYETVVYNTEIEEKINNVQSNSDLGVPTMERDTYFTEAGKFIIEKDKASIGMLQRVFRIGFNRAARIMDQLSEAGVVGEEEGTKPRKVLMSMEEFEEYIDEYV